MAPVSATGASGAGVGSTGARSGGAVGAALVCAAGASAEIYWAIRLRRRASAYTMILDTSSSIAGGSTGEFSL